MPERSACPFCNARKNPLNRTCGHEPCRDADEAKRGGVRAVPYLPQLESLDGSNRRRRFGSDGQPLGE